MRSTGKQLEDFFRSPIWADIMDELQYHENMIVAELTRSSWNHETGELESNQQDRVMLDENLRGAHRMLSIFKNLSETLVYQAEMDKEEE